MADQPLHLRPDPDLERVLRDLGEVIAWPAAAGPTAGGADLAAIVRARIEAGDVPATRRGPLLSRPIRWALVLAFIVALGLAAAAGAALLGLPGLRLELGPIPASPPPTVAPSASRPAAAPGLAMGLGTPVDIGDLDAQAGFDVRSPGDPALGPPDAAYLDPTLSGQVALVWASRPDLPATLEPGVGVVITQFRGSVDDGFFNKAAGSGTIVEPVTVGGKPGFWLRGAPHFLFYTGPDGQLTDDRRWVGDALIWRDGLITYRLEAALGRDRAIEIAESMH